MNKMLINYCYSWYRTVRRTNVSTRTDVSLAELTSEPIERADRTNVLTAEATADQRPMATARGSTDRIVCQLRGNFPFVYTS